MGYNVQDMDTLQQISFNLQYLFNARERTNHTFCRLSFIPLIRHLLTNLLFSMHKLTDYHKFRKIRSIIHIYKLNT